MKAYTDVGQSRILSRILKPESADMRYDEYVSHIDGTPKVGYKKGVTDGIPCWSLAALYALLPEKTDISKAYSNDCVTMVYWCWTVMSEDENECDMIIETSDYDNPVDACYEMIIKLHERNLL